MVHKEAEGGTGCESGVYVSCICMYVLHSKSYVDIYIYIYIHMQMAWNSESRDKHKENV